VPEQYFLPDGGERAHEPILSSFDGGLELKSTRPRKCRIIAGGHGGGRAIEGTSFNQGERHRKIGVGRSRKAHQEICML